MIAEARNTNRQLPTAYICAKSGFPTIAKIKRDYGAGFINDYVAMWIVNLQSFLSVKECMNESQILETAYLISRDYPQLNVADINAIFDRAKTGKFGELYNRLDGQILLTWFERYFDERCEACADQSIREADSMRGRDNDSPERLQRISENLTRKLKIK